jgi:hypothetical protein
MSCSCEDPLLRRWRRVVLTLDAAGRFSAAVESLSAHRGTLYCSAVLSDTAIADLTLTAPGGAQIGTGIVLTPGFPVPLSVLLTPGWRVSCAAPAAPPAEITLSFHVEDYET